MGGKVTLTCVDCGIVRIVNRQHQPIQALRCRPCSFKRRGGNLNGRWKGGITPENRRIRNSSEYKAWRKSVFERDNYTCVQCGNRGSLHADHIKEFAFHPELRLSLENGRTLCVDCHKKTSNYLAKSLRGRYCTGYGNPRKIYCECGAKRERTKDGVGFCRKCRSEKYRIWYWRTKYNRLPPA